MPKYYVGDFIRETRERRGYTQEELCYGICSVPSLSRIENGAQVPGSRRLDALLQRLGCGNQVFNEFVSKEETKIYELTKNIRRAIMDENIEELKRGLLDIEPLLKNKSKFDVQYFLFAKGMLSYLNKGSREDVLEIYMEAIHITLPEFDGITPLESKLLTFDEITILINIASLYAELERLNDALKIGFWLKGYMEKRVVDETERKKKYPVLLYNLTNWLGVKKRYDDALEICDKGINYCIQNGTLRYFPMLIFNKGCSLAELGDMEKAKKYFRQAIVILESINNEEKMKVAIAWCEKRFHIDVSF